MDNFTAKTEEYLHNNEEESLEIMNAIISVWRTRRYCKLPRLRMNLNKGQSKTQCDFAFSKSFVKTKSNCFEFHTRNNSSVSENYMVIIGKKYLYKDPGKSALSAK